MGSLKVDSVFPTAPSLCVEVCDCLVPAEGDAEIPLTGRLSDQASLLHSQWQQVLWL